MRSQSHQCPASNAPETNSFMLFWGDELFDFFLSNWLDPTALGLLDIAITNRRQRTYWLTALSAMQTNAFDNCNFNDCSLRWLILRNVRVAKIQIDCKKKSSMPDSALRGLNNGSLRSLDLSSCRRISDEGVSSLVKECSGLRNVDLSGCCVTDVSITAIAHECLKLEYTILDFWKVTDIGISALSHRCTSLASIHLGGCDVTDVSLATLAGGSRRYRR